MTEQALSAVPAPDRQAPRAPSSPAAGALLPAAADGVELVAKFFRPRDRAAAAVKGPVAFVADEASAETALQDAGIGYAKRPALTIRMENQPNADLLLPVRVSDDLFFAVICVDDLDKARRVLGVQVISEDDFVL